MFRAIPFSKAHQGRGAELFWGYLPLQFKFFDPFLHAHIIQYYTLCHPLFPHFELFNTLYPRCTNYFQVPSPWVTFQNGLALKPHI